MRNQPIAATPWEVEATRRREVIAADFGARRQPLAETPRSEHRMGPVRRLVSWISALTQTDSGPSTTRVSSTNHGDRTAGCRPGVQAVEPGS